MAVQAKVHFEVDDDSLSNGSNEDPQLLSSGSFVEAAVAEAETNKRLRAQTASFSEEFICSITQGLMVDPVVAEDGNTYERSAIVKWIETKNKSPLNPSQTLRASRLISNRAVLSCIEKVILSSTADKDLRKDWCARKKNSDLEKAQQLYTEGKVLEAAKLGLPRAQGKMAQNYWFGDNGFEKDLDKCFDFAKLASEGGDCRAQLMLGSLYFCGEDVEKDFVAALKWLKLAAEQGCLRSPASIGFIYKVGGFGVEKDFDAAFAWFKKAVDGGFDSAQYELATLYYKGLGVAKDLAMARSWFKKSSDQGDKRAQRILGMMMGTGEGGARKFSQGVALVAAAARQGDSAAIGLMETHHAFTDASWCDLL